MTTEVYQNSNYTQAEYLPYHLIYPKGKRALTNTMQSIYDVRRANLAMIIKEQFAGSQAKFADALVYEPSMVSRLLTQNPKTRQNIGAKMARKIEASSRKPQYWLDTQHNQYLIEQQRPTYNTEVGPNLQRSVPLISWVQAGHWQDVIDTLAPGDAERWIATTARVGPRSYALRIIGDSMTNPSGSPSFPEGTIIIVDPDRASDPGAFVVVRQHHDEECTFKQFVRDGHRSYLKPLNPRYPILEMEKDAVLCGVLVQAVMDF